MKRCFKGYALVSQVFVGLIVGSFGSLGSALIHRHAAEASL